MHWEMNRTTPTQLTTNTLQPLIMFSQRIQHFLWQGNMIASVDADGIVKLWDVRKVTEYATINVGPHSANRCCFDRSALVMAIASNDSRIKWYISRLSLPYERQFINSDFSLTSLISDTRLYTTPSIIRHIYSCATNFFGPGLPL